MARSAHLGPVRKKWRRATRLRGPAARQGASKAALRSTLADMPPALIERACDLKGIKWRSASADELFDLLYGIAWSAAHGRPLGEYFATPWGAETTNGIGERQMTDEQFEKLLAHLDAGFDRLGDRIAGAVRSPETPAQSVAADEGPAAGSPPSPAGSTDTPPTLEDVGEALVALTQARGRDVARTLVEKHATGAVKLGNIPEERLSDVLAEARELAAAKEAA